MVAHDPAVQNPLFPFLLIYEKQLSHVKVIVSILVMKAAGKRNWQEERDALYLYC